MKKFVSYVKRSIAVTLLILPNLLSAAKVDAPAPDFVLLNTQGEQVKLSDYRGQYVVLEWTNHLCPYVQKHYSGGNMQGLQNKYTEQDVVWLSIISSAPGKQGHIDGDKADSLTTERGAAPTAVLFDPEGTTGKQYNAKTTPHMYVIDPQGMLRYAGAIDSIKSANPADIAKATNYLDQSMMQLLAGQPVSEKMTVPYGCTIKYKG
ncbi:redoxin domain-containing protein [Planctobacterium marinum]|uniref:Thioredoxin family protein n=1 Tax=Planctobacterium marinum TaxID=1631968 RepID=A0AA48I716_9ALTE|nr:thioredoxin family protein [Planctobacterium marinum]